MACQHLRRSAECGQPVDPIPVLLHHEVDQQCFLRNLQVGVIKCHGQIFHFEGVWGEGWLHYKTTDFFFCLIFNYFFHSSILYFVSFKNKQLSLLGMLVKIKQANLQHSQISTKCLLVKLRTQQLCLWNKQKTTKKQELFFILLYTTCLLESTLPVFQVL